MPAFRMLLPAALAVLLFSPAAHADSGVKIVIERCNDINADDIGQIVAADFVDSKEGTSTITIKCSEEVATVRMLEAGTTIEFARSVDLTSVAPIARPRTLALLVSELLDTEPPASRVAEAQGTTRIHAPTPTRAYAQAPGDIPAAPAPAALTSAPKTTPSPAHRQPTFSLGIAMGIGSRNFNYIDGLGSRNVRPYESSMTPMARLDAQAYPFSKGSNFAGLGLSGTYSAAKSIASSSAEGMSLNSDSGEWDLNLRYQRALRIAKLGAELGLGQQQFEFRSDDGSAALLLDEVPSVDIRYTRLALDADVALSERVGITVGVEYRVVSEIGALAERFSETEVSAWASELGAHYWFTDSVRAQAMYTRSSYSYNFSDLSSSGGKDTFDAFLIGVGIQQ